MRIRAELSSVEPVQAGTLTDQQLFSYFNQTYFAIRPYSPDTFIMVSPLIYEVRPGTPRSGRACSTVLSLVLWGKDDVRSIP